MFENLRQQLKAMVNGNAANSKNKSDDYFAKATEWSNDRYHFIELSRDRYQAAFFASMGLSFLLTISLIAVLPLKKIEPIIVHQNDMTGEVWVAPMSTPFVPNNPAAVQSDLVNYVIARESYSTVDYNTRYQRVEFKSDDAVGREYAKSQDIANNQSPLNVLGERGTRAVTVEDVIFMNKAGSTSSNRGDRRLPAQNLAQVNFTITDTINGVVQKQYKVATISWTYVGTPSNPQAAWENWNGFTVTYYRVDQRNVPQ